MSVLGLSFGTSLRERSIAAAEWKRAFGRALRGAAAGTMLSVGAVVALNASAPANAASVLVFELNREFSGGDAVEPAGTDWWVKATFQDISGGVRLTIDTSGLVASEFLTRFYFNIGENNLSQGDSAGFFSPTATNLVPGTVEVTNSQYNSNLHRADGDGYFDARFDYPESGPGTFTKNLKSIYDLMHENLTVEKILNKSFGSGNSKDGLYVAAHIQGIFDPGKVADYGENNTEGSGWITADTYTLNPIPLPPAAFLFLTGLAGMGLLARRRRMKLGGAAA